MEGEEGEAKYLKKLNEMRTITYAKWSLAILQT
jgi:hypothetical protein